MLIVKDNIIVINIFAIFIKSSSAIDDKLKKNKILIFTFLHCNIFMRWINDDWGGR